MMALFITHSLKAADANELKYPTAARTDTVDTYNGVQVADPYRWLEQLDSSETRAWVLAEAQLTEQYLAKIPARKTLRERLTELLNYEKNGVPFRRQGRYFYTHNEGLQPQSVLYKSEGLAGRPSLLLDPNTLSTNGSIAVVGYDVSSDGRILAYGVSEGGSDWTEWRFRDIESGVDLPDVLRWTKYYAPVFAPDNKGVYYSSFPAPKKGEELSAKDLGNAVYYHQFGTPTSADRIIYQRNDHPTWQFEPQLAANSQWLVIVCGDGQVGDKNRMNLYLLDVDAKDASVLTLVENFDASYVYIGQDAGQLYFQTTLNAPRGCVVAIDPKKTEPANWKRIIQQGPDTLDPFGSVTLVNHQLIVRTLHDVHSQVQVFTLNGEPVRTIHLPGTGSASGFQGKPTDTETFYSYTDLITPSTIFRLDLKTGKSSIYRAPKVPFDPSAYEARQVFYASNDGTRVPMFIVHRKGLVLDGTNPTLLYGYGGFAISMLPRFQPTRLAWLERGGVFAIANIRGGGEYGEEWHQQGIRERKRVGFEDFIAAAEWLIAQKYTSKEKLAIEGHSNGGLLVGACVTRRPDLFGAVLAYVGVMDMLRFDRFGQGEGWTGDYGSPQKQEEFEVLRSYSPYHNVRPGTTYPAIMVITGDHDTRVMPAHSFKFAAALQAAQRGPAPILLKVHLTAGHGGGVTTKQRIEEEADAYAFLLANLKAQ